MNKNFKTYAVIGAETEGNTLKERGGMEKVVS